MGGWIHPHVSIPDFELEGMGDHGDHDVHQTGLSPDSAALAGYPE